MMKNIGVVVNRARGDLILNSEMVDYEDVSKILKVPAIGVVPEDDAINLLSNLGLMINPESEGWEAMDVLARNLHYGTTVMYDVTKKYKGFWGGLKRNLRKII